MIEAYKTITVEVDVNGRPHAFEVPFTVELLERVEETIQRTAGRQWFRLSPKEKSIIEAFDWFAAPYVDGLDLKQVHPTFTALFFSSVKSELVSSINAFEKLIISTEESTAPTAESPTAAVQASA